MRSRRSSNMGRVILKNCRRTLDHAGGAPLSLMIMTHGCSPLRFQPVPYPTGFWYSPFSFLLYHPMCFQHKLHETNIQHVQGCKFIHGSGQKKTTMEIVKSGIDVNCQISRAQIIKQ